MKKIRVIHQREKCIGCNSCTTIAPQSWVIDPVDGKSTLVGSQKKRDHYVGDVFECDEEANKIAAEACPVNIIKVNT